MGTKLGGGGESAVSRGQWLQGGARGGPGGVPPRGDLGARDRSAPRGQSPEKMREGPSSGLASAEAGSVGGD